MSQYLPTGGFRWIDDGQQLAKTIAEQPADDPEGYILEVDPEYPEDLHDTQMHIRWHRSAWFQKKWMSEYQYNLISVGVAPTEVEKLVPNLRQGNAEMDAYIEELLVTSKLLENPIRRKLRVRWHNKEFLAAKATRRPILQVIQHGLVGLGHRASQPVHLKRPHRVCSASTTTFQLARLVKEANTNSRGNVLLLGSFAVAQSFLIAVSPFQ